MKKVLLSLMVVAGMAMINETTAQSSKEGKAKEEKTEEKVNHNTVRRAKKKATRGESGKTNTGTEEVGSSKTKGKEKTKGKSKENKKAAPKKDSELVIPKKDALIFIED